MYLKTLHIHCIIVFVLYVYTNIFIFYKYWPTHSFFVDSFVLFAILYCLAFAIVIRALASVTIIYGYIYILCFIMCVCVCSICLCCERVWLWMLLWTSRVFYRWLNSGFEYYYVNKSHIKDTSFYIYNWYGIYFDYMHVYLFICICLNMCVYIGGWIDYLQWDEWKIYIYLINFFVGYKLFCKMVLVFLWFKCVAWWYVFIFCFVDWWIFIVFMW